MIEALRDLMNQYRGIGVEYVPIDAIEALIARHSE